MRRRDEELSKGWGQIATPLVIQTEGGPQKINCANTAGGIPNYTICSFSQGEPFKRWLAKYAIAEMI